MPSQATLRVQSVDQGWQALGIDRDRGVVPENIRASANLWGPDSLGCVLKRRPGAIFPDLATWTPCELEIGGVVVWDGRLKEAPEQDGDSMQVALTGEGWQYHLDDDTNEKCWVHTRLPDYADVRSLLTADLTAYTAGWTIEAGSGAIVLRNPPGNTAAAASRTGVVLDTGDAAGVKRVVVTYDAAGAAYNLNAYNGSTAVASDESTTLDASPLANATGNVVSFTFTTARRYFRLEMIAVGATAGADTHYIRITGVQVFSSTAYESGNASILKTSDIIKTVLPWAPLLSQDTSQVSATTFSWPDAAPFEEKTPREIIEAFNAAEWMQARLLIGRVLQYRAYPSSPLFEIGAWSGAQFADASANSGDGVYNKAKVTGTASDGTKLTVASTQTGTLADRAAGGAFTRTKLIPVSAGLNTTLGNKINGAFLGTHRTTPLKGSVQASRGGVRWIQGGSVEPALLLLYVGEMMRLSHRVDPDTGAWGRDGTIAQVEYDHDSEIATVSLDDSRDTFDALLARLGAILGGG